MDGATARLFEIVPTTAMIRRGDGSVERDDRLMYAIGEDAEKALDIVLQPYGENGTWYLDRLQVEAPGPWVFVALSREYDIADYVIAQRNEMDSGYSFKFTFYQARNITTEEFAPNVACCLFFSTGAVAAAAGKIRVLQPAWMLLRDQPDYKHWLVLLDEEPASVLTEAGHT